MLRGVVLAAVLLTGLGLVSALRAQPGLDQPSPYAGMQTRPVKTLSPEQIADLKAGRGMSLALAAELNGYPGPAHVLELADELDLSSAQRAQTQSLVQAMRAEAVAAGERVLAAEAALDRLFAERRATPQAVATATAEAGLAQARLRAVHLEYHLKMAEVLSPHQAARYNELRGYADMSGHGRHGGHGNH